MLLMHGEFGEPDAHIGVSPALWSIHIYQEYWDDSCLTARYLPSTVAYAASPRDQTCDGENQFGSFEQRFCKVYLL